MLHIRPLHTPINTHINTEMASHSPIYAPVHTHIYTQHLNYNLSVTDYEFQSKRGHPDHNSIYDVSIASYPLLDKLTKLNITGLEHCQSDAVCCHVLTLHDNSILLHHYIQYSGKILIRIAHYILYGVESGKPLTYG